MRRKYRFMQENVVVRAVAGTCPCHSACKPPSPLLQANRAGASEKVPAIESTLQAIAAVASSAAKGEDLVTHYNLSDQVFAEARVPPTDKVAVYLGVRMGGRARWLPPQRPPTPRPSLPRQANVTLEYPIAEAQAMLEKQLAVFRTKLVRRGRRGERDGAQGPPTGACPPRAASVGGLHGGRGVPAGPD